MNGQNLSRNSDEARRGHHALLVSAPPCHEGVGNALRTAFAPPAKSLPDDFLDLLARIR